MLFKFSDAYYIKILNNTFEIKTKTVLSLLFIFILPFIVLLSIYIFSINIYYNIKLSSAFQKI